MKRLLVLSLCMVMLLCQGSVFAIDRSYESASEWAQEEIRDADTANIVSIWGFDSFQDAVTREEFCSYLLDIYYRLTDGSEKYTEIQPDYGKWQCFEDTVAYGAVESVCSMGVIKGVSETKFEPERPITREEAAVMLCRLFEKIGYKTSEADLGKYADRNLISPWAKDSVEKLWNCEPFASVLNNDEIIPQGTISHEEMIVMSWRFYEEDRGEKEILYFEETTPELLVELGIVDAEDFRKGGYISLEETFNILKKYSTFSRDVNLKEWYEGTELEKLDGIPDERKKLLLTMEKGLNNPIVPSEEFENIRFDENLTRYGAFLYLVRYLDNSDGCIVSYDYLTQLDREILYDVASEFELTQRIYNAVTKKADKAYDKKAFCAKARESIPRQEFYALLHKALFCRHMVGGYIDEPCRYVDWHMNRWSEEEPTKTISTEIKPENIVIHDDLSITWDFPESLVSNDVQMNEYILSFDFLDKNGEEVAGYIVGWYEEIHTKEVLLSLIDEYPKVPVKIRCSYTDYRDTREGMTSFEYWFDIDLSNVKVIESDEELNPGTVWKPKGLRILDKLTLTEGDVFEEGAWYLLTSYEHAYRKEEYNARRHELFRAEKTADVFVPEGNTVVYADYVDDMHIRKVTVDGAAKEGFEIYITPESRAKFEARTIPE